MDKIEEKIIKIIDDNKEKLIAFARDIYTHAELGYKEFQTSGKFVKKMHQSFRMSLRRLD